ncbi:hypothetical protein SEUCBS139899_008823 [Sporothrix eucalyptigena]|uniref:Ig-like domain-containing protein n=1 Tax=Sporothrix eucalyptigena TaxID=1812306 RepID=A0ABP0D227_9PEZI
MKFPTTASILALGLALVSPVSAANCKLSKPASVSPSSSSSTPASSSSSAPVAPAAPTNVVKNPDFANNAAYWALTGSSSVISPCVGKDSCLDATDSSDYTTSFSQTVTTVAGTTYSFSVDYYLQSLSGSATLVCTLTDSVSGGVTTFTYSIDGYNPGYFQAYTGTYTALSDTTALQCTLSTTIFAELYFTDVILIS